MWLPHFYLLADLVLIAVLYTDRHSPLVVTYIWGTLFFFVAVSNFTKHDLADNECSVFSW